MERVQLSEYVPDGSHHFLYTRTRLRVKRRVKLIKNSPIIVARVHTAPPRVRDGRRGNTHTRVFLYSIMIVMPLVRKRILKLDT